MCAQSVTYITAIVDQYRMCNRLKEVKCEKGSVRIQKKDKLQSVWTMYIVHLKCINDQALPKIWIAPFEIVQKTISGNLILANLSSICVDYGEWFLHFIWLIDFGKMFAKRMKFKLNAWLLFLCYYYFALLSGSQSQKCII